eukprot:10678537-Heterocapsa_arctica.AAC.1
MAIDQPEPRPTRDDRQHRDGATTKHRCTARSTWATATRLGALHGLRARGLRMASKLLRVEARDPT